MDERLQLTLLYDFYGGLLTEKQREIYEMYYLNDLSLSEIGDDSGVSRQAVCDLLRRTKKLLLGYEDRLGLVARHVKMLSSVETLTEGLASARECMPHEAYTRMETALLTLKEL